MANVFFRKKINSDKLLGEKLRHYRKKKHLSLEQAEEETRVRLKYLEALETGDYAELPADVYALGFLSKYADFLNISKDELIHLTQDFRRETAAFNIPGTAQITSLKRRSKKEKFFITPKTFVICLGAVIGLALVLYVAYSIKNFTAPPNLEISAPSTETVIRQNTVEVIGKTDPGSSLRINDQIVFIDPVGNFKEQVRLQSGMNNVEISSTNRVKKETVKVIKILAEF